MRILLCIALVLSVSSCATNRLPVADGHTEIKPEKTLKVGHLYFSGEGRVPAFTTADGVTYNELCYKDFGAETVLGDLSAYIEDDGVRVDEVTINPQIGLSGGVGVPSLGTVTPSVTAGYKRVVSNMRLYKLKPGGVEFIESNLGPNCPTQIDTMIKEGRDVILLVAAERADSIVDNTTYKGDVNVSQASGLPIDLSNIKPSAGTSSVVQYKMVYISGRLSPFDTP